jgi:hypothetical protein
MSICGSQIYICMHEKNYLQYDDCYAVDSWISLEINTVVTVLP